MDDQESDQEIGFTYYNEAGELHREDGPAFEGDKTNIWYLHGKEVTEQEVAAYRLAKEQALRMKKSWEQEQIRQLTEGTAAPLKVRGPLRLRKP
jgi:hypothetical protein